MSLFYLNQEMCNWAVCLYLIRKRVKMDKLLSYYFDLLSMLFCHFDNENIINTYIIGLKKRIIFFLIFFYYISNNLSNQYSLLYNLHNINFTYHVAHLQFYIKQKLTGWPVYDPNPVSSYRVLESCQNWQPYLQA